MRVGEFIKVKDSSFYNGVSYVVGCAYKMGPIFFVFSRKTTLENIAEH